MHPPIRSRQVVCTPASQYVPPPKWTAPDLFFITGQVQAGAENKVQQGPVPFGTLFDLGHIRAQDFAVVEPKEFFKHPYRVVSVNLAHSNVHRKCYSCGKVGFRCDFDAFEAFFWVALRMDGLLFESACTCVRLSITSDNDVLDNST